MYAGAAASNSRLQQQCSAQLWLYAEVSSWQSHAYQGQLIPEFALYSDFSHCFWAVVLILWYMPGCYQLLNPDACAAVSQACSMILTPEWQ